MSTTIDDNNPAVTYSSGWTLGGSPNEVDQTVHSTLTPGSSFKVAFTGTSIGVYGTLDYSSGNVITSYSIDGGTAVPITSQATANGDDSFKNLLWQSPTLASGAHTLEATVVQVDTADEAGGGEGTIWFDYFLVGHDTTASTGAGLTSASTTAAAQSTSSPSHASSFQTVPGSSSSSASPSSTGTSLAAANTPAAKSKSMGGVVGGVIAALVIILAATAFFLFWWRNRKRRRVPADGEFKGESYPFVTGPARTPGTALVAPFGASTSALDAKFEPYAGFSSPPPGAYAAPPSSFNTSRLNDRPTTPSSRPSLETTTSMAIAPSRAFMIRNDPDAQSSMDHKPSGPLTLTYLPPIATTEPLTSAPDPDSVAELKRRQQEHLAQYNQRLLADDIGGSGSQLVQHVDSGIRTAAPVVTEELPPVYTPA